jgi:hypothetical protein
MHVPESAGGAIYMIEQASAARGQCSPAVANARSGRSLDLREFLERHLARDFRAE